MTPKDWFTTLAGQSLVSCVVGVAVFFITYLAIGTMSCVVIGSNVVTGGAANASTTVNDGCLSAFGLQDPSVMSMNRLTASFIFGALAGIITFGIEKLVSK
jgi:hypothetical protein